MMLWWHCLGRPGVIAFDSPCAGQAPSGRRLPHRTALLLPVPPDARQAVSAAEPATTMVVFPAMMIAGGSSVRDHADGMAPSAAPANGMRGRKPRRHVGQVEPATLLIAVVDGASRSGVSRVLPAGGRFLICMRQAWFHRAQGRRGDVRRESPALGLL